jgi:defect-in-organelle-trafficking protein DotC
MPIALPPSLPADIDSLADLRAPVAEVRTAGSPGAAVVPTDTLSARQRAVQEAACSIGARGGLASAGARISKWLESRADTLDAKFPFGILLLRDGVLPAVVTESRDLVSQDRGQDSIRYGKLQYRMVEQARFVTVTPTWRDYLYAGLPSSAERVTLPASGLLPRDSDEKSVWTEAVRRCWSDGEAQAKAIEDLNFNRFERDYAGMTRFRILVQRGVITAPVVSTQIAEAIRKAGELTLDDVTKRITTQPDFDGRIISRPAARP